MLQFMNVWMVDCKGMDVITETLQSKFPRILALGSCDTKTTGLGSEEVDIPRK